MDVMTQSARQAEEVGGQHRPPDGAGSRVGTRRPGTSLRRAGAVVRAGSGSRVGRLVRYSAVSVVSTAVSQVMLVATYGLGLLSARDAAVAATLAGAIPSYWLNRRWAWGRSGRSRTLAEMLPYFLSVVAGLIVSTWATDAASTWAHHLNTGHLARTAVVAAAYLTSFGVLWLAKFAVNEVIFRSRPSASRPPRQSLAGGTD